MKLFRVEWAAITLEKTWRGQTRSNLVLCYNHLVLPGTTLSRDCLSVDMKIANYNVIRKIATADEEGADDAAIVRALEGGVPGNLTLLVDVPLRLGPDN